MLGHLNAAHCALAKNQISRRSNRTMKRCVRKLFVTLKKGWRNAGGFDSMSTFGAMIIACTVLTTYLGVVLRDPFISMAVKLYWSAFVGSILLFLLYGVTRNA